MEQITTKQITKQNPRPSLSITPSLASNIAVCAVSFFIGRVVIFQSLNPLTPAFIGCLSFGTGFYGAVIFSFLGLLTGSGITSLSKYIIYLAVMFAANVLIPPSKRKYALSLRPAFSSSVILVSGLIFAVINYFSFYYTVLAFLEAALTLCLSMVLEKGTDSLSGKNLFRLSFPEREDIIGIALIAGAVIAGSSDIIISGIDLSFLFSVLGIMLAAYIYGAAAGIAAAAMITLVTALSCSRPFELMCIFSAAAAFSSVSPKIKKLSFAFIFALTFFVLSLYLKKSLLSKEITYSFAISVVIFFLLPVKRLESIKPVPTNADEYISRLNSLTTSRLRDFSAAFSKLSRALTSLSQRRSSLEKKEVSSIIDDVAAQLCVKCDMRSFCWDSNFYSTYQNIFAMLSACEQKGFAEKSDINEAFEKSCIKKDKFLQTINRMYELHKNNMLWQNKISESRELVSQQLSGVSSIINDLSDELSIDMSYKARQSEKVQNALEEYGCLVKNVVVSETKAGQTEVLINHAVCGGTKKCIKGIIPVVNSVLNKKFCNECSQCITQRKNRQNLCTLKLVEEKRFRIVSSVSSAKKDGSIKSGDSTTFMPLPDGKYLLALSDAMGSGSQAHRESAAAIELFEDFISAGFNKQTAVNMINSVLVLKSDQTSFSTLDVCTVDLNKGEAEFIKIGAVTSFIKHEGGVDTIKSNSLPAGVLSKIDAEVTVRSLADSDIIVMVSDGIIDSSSSLNNKEGFIISVLENSSNASPAEIADEILNRAINNSKGSINDDMTVLAAKISERRI